MKPIKSSKQPTSNSQQPTQNGTQPKSNFKRHISNSLEPNNDSKQPKSKSIQPKCTTHWVFFRFYISIWDASTPKRNHTFSFYTNDQVWQPSHSSSKQESLKQQIGVKKFAANFTQKSLAASQKIFFLSLSSPVLIQVMHGLDIKW